jgi:amino acid efflux transporter
MNAGFRRVICHRVPALFAQTDSMANSGRAPLSATGAAALYIGALLGPSLLLLPGLAARLAGPASILDWATLLVLSGLLAWVFTALGTRFPGRGGVSAYTRSGLGPVAGRAVGWCFVAGAVAGAPVVCLIGGQYVAAAFGGGQIAAVAAAGLLLAAVLTIRLAGTQTTTGMQLVLVAVLIVLVVIAVVGSASAVRTDNWIPLAPRGWTALGPAGAALMLSFVGWEAVASLTGRLPDPARQLPRVITAAFTVTGVVYLALAAATIGVLGDAAGTDVPLAALLDIAIGPAGPAAAAVAAVALTLAATNAYLSGAAALAHDLQQTRNPARVSTRRWPMPAGMAACGAVLLAAVAAGLLTTAQLVAIPTGLFLLVYLGCTTSAARILRGPARVAAGVAAAAVCVILAFTGAAITVPAAVVAAAGLTGPLKHLLARFRRAEAAAGPKSWPVASGAAAEPRHEPRGGYRSVK